jgi:F-type H+-transporting ATPase subunit b
VINWTTVAFQIVNFLILLFLLWLFLYGRIIKAMDEREARIAARLTEAEEKRRQADEQAETFRQKTEQLDAQRDEFLTKAKADADAERKELTAQARAEVDQTRAQWHEAVQREKEGFLQDLRQRATAQTLAIARRALADLAGDDLEGRVLETFLAQIGNLDDAERGKFAEAVANTAEEEEDRHVVVRSAFDLPDDGRQRLTEAVHAHIADGTGIRFETSAELICGIELVAGGTKLAWSIEHYLATLEEDLAEAFETSPGPQAGGDA